MIFAHDAPKASVTGRHCLTTVTRMDAETAGYCLTRRIDPQRALIFLGGTARVRDALISRGSFGELESPRENR